MMKTHSYNFEDLTGQIYGCFEVICEAAPRYRKNGKVNIIWHCRCINCSFEKDIAANHIKRRPNKCPNCTEKKTTLIDLTNSKVGNVLVKDRAPDALKGNGKHRTMWNCVCLICEKEFVRSASDLKVRNESCGCVSSERKKENRTIDFIGMKIGRLTIKKRLEDYIKPSGGSDRRWLCYCDCGNECVKTTAYLQNSPIPSCGCWKNEESSEQKTNNLVGQCFGVLVVLERIKNHITSGGNQQVMYLCGCFNCGGTTEVTANALVNGQQSCGCIKSLGEKNIAQWLRENKYNYISQYSFKDLYYKDPKHPLLFDFAITNTENELLFLIEYQWKQHYEQVDKTGEFGKLQREVTDKMKKDYCHAHNISLFEIRYDENIQDSLENIFTTYVNFVLSSTC